MRNMLVYKQWMHGPVAEHQRWVQAFCPWRLKHHCVAINGWTVELWECWMKLLVHGSRHEVKHACFWDCSLHWKKMQSRIGMDKLMLISNWMLLRQHRVASTCEVRAWTMFGWWNMFPGSPIISHQPLVIMYISLSLVFLWAPLAIFCVFSKQQSQCIKKTVLWVWTLIYMSLEKIIQKEVMIVSSCAWWEEDIFHFLQLEAAPFYQKGWCTTVALLHRCNNVLHLEM